MKPRLQEHYDKALKASLMEEFGYKNVMEVPRLDKIVVNMGVGEAVADTKKIKSAVGEMALITGQQPVDRKRVVEGKSVSVRVDLGGRGILTEQKKDN